MKQSEHLFSVSNVEELYEITGEFDIVPLVSTADIEEFRDVSKNKIMKIPGVKSTVSSIILEAHKHPSCGKLGSGGLS
jgi:DNA-binding Lrp family transcriptional regulator